MYKLFVSAFMAALVAGVNVIETAEGHLQQRDQEGFCAKRTNTCWDEGGELGECDKGECTVDNNLCKVIRACGGMGFCDAWIECE